MDMPMLGGHCKCPHHKIIPLAIVLIGLAFLLQALNVLSAGFVALAWPILVIIIGLMKLTKGMCKCCKM
jgi:hypothetical protein